MKSEVGIQKLMAISINNVPSSDVPEMSETPLLRRQLHMQGPRGGTGRQRGGRARGWQGHRAPERGAGAHSSRSESGSASGSDGSLNQLCLYRPPTVHAYRPFASMGRSCYDILESPVDFGAKTNSH